VYVFKGIDWQVDVMLVMVCCCRWLPTSLERPRAVGGLASSSCNMPLLRSRHTQPTDRPRLWMPPRGCEKIDSCMMRLRWNSAKALPLSAPQ